MATADDADLRRKIVGTWKLVSVAYEDQSTGERTPVYGAHPKGVQIATPEGRWLALMTAEGRHVPQSEADRAQALKTMIAYTGRYRVEGGSVVTKVEAAWNEAWVGTEQVRAVRFRRRNAVAPKPADAASEHQRQGGARDCRMAARIALNLRVSPH